MKIKFFSNTDFSTLETKVNEFLNSGIEVIDIKFQGYDTCTDIMVIYQEKAAN